MMVFLPPPKPWKSAHCGAVDAGGLHGTPLARPQVGQSAFNVPSGGPEQEMRSEHRTSRTRKSAPRGYTLIEFMMTMAIFAVLVALAVPSIQSGFSKQHLRTATIEIMDVFGFARVQAMSRNRAYLVRVTGEGTPNGKFAVSESGSTRCSDVGTGMANVKVLDLSVGDFDDIRVVASGPNGFGNGSFSLCFLPNGRVVKSDTLLPVEGGEGWGAGEAWFAIQGVKEGTTSTTMGLIHRIVIPYNGVPEMLPGMPGTPHV